MELADKQKGLFEVFSQHIDVNVMHYNLMIFSSLQKAEQNADADADEEVVIPFPDLLDVARCLELGGVSPFINLEY